MLRKDLCLNIYFMRPKAYRSLSETFLLPSKQSLTRVTTKLEPSVDDVLLSAVQINVYSFTALHTFCTLCVDEASIKANLFYHIGIDSILDFEEFRNEVI